MSVTARDPRQLLAASTAGYVVGALYNRQRDIHTRFGGQEQSGIVTPRSAPLVIVFTSTAGQQHGYLDYWDDSGAFHYYGHGQTGDMDFRGGNKAIRDHVKNEKQLLVFQSLGRVRTTDSWGSLSVWATKSSTTLPPGMALFATRSCSAYNRSTTMSVRSFSPDPPPFLGPEWVDSTVREVVTTVRTKQDLFRRRLTSVECGCRLTNVYDLRFLRTSHIKLWAASDDRERVDCNNGLLLTPSADLLFDNGWISFEDSGRLLVSAGLPDEINEKVGLDLSRGRDCGAFTTEQRGFLEYHRDCVFGQREFQERLIEGHWVL